MGDCAEGEVVMVQKINAVLKKEIYKVVTHRITARSYREYSHFRIYGKL